MTDRVEPAAAGDATLPARDARAFLHQSTSSPVERAIVSAEGCWLVDAEGRRILDLHGNSCHHLGYAHPRLLAALAHQAATLPFSPRRFTNPVAVELVERLTTLWPWGSARVLFAPSGSDAIEIALKIARVATGRHKTIAFRGCWHGAGFGALSLGGRNREKPEELGPLLPGAFHVPPYWDTQGRVTEEAGRESLRAIASIIDREGGIAAVVAQPIQATPRLPPAWYWPEVRELCSRHGSLLIFDEIPAGLGKTGRLFAAEHVGAAPDMTVLGKALGGAILPLAAVIARDDLNRAGHLGIGHYTHEKNPTACRIALEVLAVIEEEGLAARAWETGQAMRKALLDGDRARMIIRVEAVGLMLAIDLARPVAAEAQSALLQAGINLSTAGPRTLSLTAPLTIAPEEANTVVAGILRTLSALA